MKGAGFFGRPRVAGDADHRLPRCEDLRKFDNSSAVRLGGGQIAPAHTFTSMHTNIPCAVSYVTATCAKALILRSASPNPMTNYGSTKMIPSQRRAKM